MIDAHAHIHDEAFDADRDEAVRRAREAGVSRIVTIGTDLTTSRQAVECAEKYEGVFAAVGIHPDFFGEEGAGTSSPFRKGEVSSLRDGGVRLWSENITPHPDEASGSSPFGKEEPENWIRELRELAKHPKVVGIGECGLDYFVRDRQPTTDNSQLTISDEKKKNQKEGFLAQIGLAREFGLPLIVHCRPSAGTADAYEDLYSILQSNIIHLKSVVLHCYMGDTEMTKKFLRWSNIWFSFAGNVTYPVKKAAVGTKDDITETVRLVPLEQLLVETDCPYLAPQAHRGERNEPAFVRLTGEYVGRLKNVTKEAADAILEKNSREVFDFNG